MQRFRGLGVVLMALAAPSFLGCNASSNVDNPGDDSGAGGDSGTGGRGAGGGAVNSMLCPTCQGNLLVACDTTTIDCSQQGLLCIPGSGCGTCAAGTKVCVGNEVHACGSDGQAGELIATCDVSMGQVCVNSACVSGCDVAQGEPSNVGCLFWAVDLENAPLEGAAFGIATNAAKEPWGIAIANTGSSPANVTIERNMAAVGDAPNIQTVAQLTIDPGALAGQVMPTLEVDGSADDNPGDPMAPGTAVTAHAFRVTSSSPVVIYQFNTVNNSFSNDASLLLPQNALGTEYRALTYVPSNPMAPLFAGAPNDHVFLTVVGTIDGTQVTINPSYKVRGGGPVTAGPAGTPVVVTLNAFDVLNLEADDATLSDLMNSSGPDLSGSTVQATQPVAVFVGSEASIAPVDSNTPTPPDFDTMQGGCCTDHTEDQLFPITSVGKTYLVSRSAVRSTGGYLEPDVVRFVGVAETATVTTSLPAPFDSFTIQPGEMKETWTRTSFTVDSDKPVMVGQILVSQAYCSGVLLGDPSLTIYAPVEQFRTQYLFLTPGSWDQTDVVVSAPKGTNVQVDGNDWSDCQAEDTPLTVGGVAYEVRTCVVQAGVHSAKGDQPIGIVAYGYGMAGSYAHVGGADVRPIYAPPPIK